MSLQDFNQILVIILLIVIIIGIVVLVIQISRTLKTLNFILEDTENITGKISYFTDHPEAMQKAAEKYVVESLNTIVNDQVERVRKSFARDFLGGLIQSLRR